MEKMLLKWTEGGYGWEQEEIGGGAEGLSTKRQLELGCILGAK